MADNDNTDAVKALEEKMATMQATMQATIDSLEGKSAGILSDKKKEQAAKDALQDEIDELKSKDLGEVERLKLDMERLQSKFDLSETQKAELEATYSTEKRNNALGKIQSGFKFLDAVPQEMRDLIVKNAMEGVDLGNEVLVADKVKFINETYAGQLAADVSGGTGSTTGNPSAPTNKPTADQIANPNLGEVAKDPLAYVLASSE